MIDGIRRPPSSSSVFRPVNGHVSANRSPPLSLVKMTMVLSVRRLSSSALSTRPICVSMASIISLIGLLRAAVVVHDAAARDAQTFGLRLVARRFPRPVRRVEVQAQEERLTRLARIR